MPIAMKTFACSIYQTVKPVMKVVTVYQDIVKMVFVAIVEIAALCTKTAQHTIPVPPNAPKPQPAKGHALTQHVQISNAHR
tara:strand:+ start:183 stop:425 length:243 start_codon:yes stop_codon:yes gene_type:complete